MEEACDEDYSKCTSCVTYWYDRGDHKKNNLWGEDHEHWMIFESRCILWLNWSSIDKLSLDTSTTSCSAQCGRWKAAFTRRCPPTLALWQGGAVIVIVIVIVIVNGITRRCPIQFQFTIRNFCARQLLFVRTELLTCSALVNSYNNIKQQAERITRLEDHFSLVSLVSLFFLPTIDNFKWTHLWQGVQLPLLSEELHLSWWSRPVSWEYWGSSLNIENIEGHL